MAVFKSILLVGQIYQDTILNVPNFPEEDSKIRAYSAQQRTGGNTCNTAKVLSQFNAEVWFMSAAGSRETSSHVIESLRHVNTNDTILYRDGKILPSSIIIHNEKTGSRTIVSNNDLEELSCDEFVQTFNAINKGSRNQWWIHFEGRNIKETLLQLDWIHNKATKEGWRDALTLSVEIEKPEREGIESLIEKGDVVLFSKVFAQHHQFSDARTFLKEWPVLKLKLKPSAIALCTDGAKGACLFDNATQHLFEATPPSIQKVVDTVGAGDTFNAGIILYLSQNPSQLYNALQFACRLATKKVGQQGFDQLGVQRIV